MVGCELSPLHRCRGWPNLRTNMDRHELSCTVLTWSKRSKRKLYCACQATLNLLRVLCLRPLLCTPGPASWGTRGWACANSARSCRPQMAPSPSNNEVAGRLSSCCTTSKEKTTNPTVIEERKRGQPTETIKTSPRKNTMKPLNLFNTYWPSFFL